MGGVHFLVVEDDRLVAKSLALVLKKFGDVEIVPTVAEAMVKLDKPWTGLIVDIGLPDGSGLDVARVARSRDPVVALLILSGGVERQLLATAYEIAASYLLKPAAAKDLKLFAARASTNPQSNLERIGGVVDEWRAIYGLSRSETQVLRLTATGQPRSLLPQLRGVSRGTIKKQAMSILRRTGDDSLESAVSRLLREALAKAD